MASNLSFTRQTFAKLSPHPFLVANLQPSDPSAKPERTNGRGPNELREPLIHGGSLTHAHGSAVVRIGDTSVICGVRGEILPVSNIPHYRPKSALEQSQGDEDAGAEGRRELKDYDLLVPNIELATGSAPRFLPGAPPTSLAQTLSTRVYSLLHSCRILNADDLRIWYTPAKADGGQGDDAMQQDDDVEENQPEVKAYWTLYIDLFFISYDGNPFDAAWAAVLAALKNTSLPKAWWDEDREMVVCSRGEKKALSIQGLPVACTAAILLEKEHATDGNSWVLMDPDRLEEDMCDETVTMVVDCASGETRIRSISKSGGPVVGLAQMKQFATLAEKRWQQVHKAMEENRRAL